QHILYDQEDIRRFHRLRERDVFGDSAFVLLVVGRYATPGENDPLAFVRLLGGLAERRDVRSGLDWAVCAFGVAETGLLMAAAALGGHVRVGFENNLLRADGALAASNAERVAN